MNGDLATPASQVNVKGAQTKTCRPSHSKAAGCTEPAAFPKPRSFGRRDNDAGALAA